MKRAARPRQGRRPGQARPGSADEPSTGELLTDANGATDWPAYDEPATPTPACSALVSDGELDAGRRCRRGEIARSSSTARRSTPSPAARSPTPASSPGTARRLEVLDVQRPVKGLVAHQVRVARGRADARARRAQAEVDHDVAPAAPARRTRAPTSCTPRCARCSARRRCSPAPTTGPATCGSTSPGQGALAREQRADDRGGRQRRRPRRPPVTAHLHDAAARPGVRRPGAVRRDLRRAGARRRDRRPVVARALRWHARARQRARSARSR